MKPEEAKKIAEAIAMVLVSPQGVSIESIKDRCVEILIADPAAPVEKEYRAGEWLPQKGCFFWLSSAIGDVHKELWDGAAQSDLYRLSQGNVYPTEAIAEAAKKHAEFWRAFDMADEDEGYEIYARRSRPGKIGTGFTTWRYGCPKFKSEESARAWVDSHGGEAYVSEMLTKGRVFRFKCGVE